MAVPIYGREEELAALERGLASGAVLIEGDAGIGKTSLWNATRERVAHDATVLSATPSESEVEFAFQGASDLLVPVIDGVLDDLPPPQRSAIAQALLLEAALQPPEPHTVAAAFLSILSALGRRSRVVVAVDDLQWLDAASGRLLEFAARRVADAPVSFLLARRGAGAVPFALDRALGERLCRVHAGPLSLGALRSLLRDRLGASLPRPLLMRLHDASGGNAFYALELARALLKSGGDIDAGRPLPVPSSLADLVSERIVAQPPRVRETLAAAAVTRDPTLRDLDADEEVDAAVEAGLLVLDGDRIRFAHPLLAAEAYASAGAEVRRRIHARLSATAASIEERARHAGLAAREPSESIAAALEEAAAAAAARGAPTAAAELARLAVTSTPADGEALLRRRLAAAEYAIRGGVVEAPRSELEAIAAALEPGAARAAVLATLASLHEADLARAWALLEQALAEAEADPATVARIRCDRAQVELLRGSLDHARAEAREAVAAAEGSDDAVLLARAQASHGLMEALAGARLPDEAWSRALAVERGDSGAGYGPTLSRALTLMYEDRVAESRVLFDETAARAEADGDELALVTAAAHRTELECRAGSFADAERHADVAYSLVGQVGWEQSQSGCVYARALVDAYLGRADAARAGALDGIAMAEELGDPIFLSQSEGVLGFLYLSLGEAEAAADVLLRAHERVESMGYGDPSIYPLLPNAIEALTLAGRIAPARELVTQLLERGRALDSPWALALGTRCQGLVLMAEGRSEDAERALREALVEHDRLPSPFERARTTLALGTVLRRLRRRGEARAHIEQAIRSFDECGAELWAARARAELARVSGRARSGELTATEERVARLVAEGRANKEVAAELVVSLRTVEAHLSSIYAKLGVRGRTELAHRLSR